MKALEFILLVFSLLLISFALVAQEERYGNRYGTDANSERVYSPSGHYMGNLNDNRYDRNSVSNPYGRHGSRYSPDSINNPYGSGGGYYGDDEEG